MVQALRFLACLRITGCAVVLSGCFITTALATTWYVRDGGGNPAECTGTTNAVYPGRGANQPCAFSNPMFALGAGCGNTGFGPCDVPGVMQPGDTLNIVGDSDINPGTQAQYPIGYDANGIITPARGNKCTAAGALDCTMGNMPANATIIGIGTHRPQLWGREHLNQVLNANGGGAVTIDNLEITQHSSCVYNGVNPNGTHGGFPDACNTTRVPFGPWAITGISLTGSGITLQNSWIHGMGQWGITTGGLTNFTEQRNIISGNGGGGVGLGQLIGNGGSMTLGGTTTVSHEIIVFNGCGEVYPMRSDDPFDTLNYYNCADDSSSNGTILADGWGIEAGTASCNLVNMSNSIISFNTKGGVDNLHCNGTGTFNMTRCRMEGNESQQLKINYANANIENSQIINDCNFFQGQPFTTNIDGGGVTPPRLGYDFCRAAGNGVRIAVVNNGRYNLYNSTFFSDGGANIELPPGTCNASTQVNIFNNLVIGSSDYTSGGTQNTSFWENDTGSCNPIREDYNLVYQVNNTAQCAGSRDICNNPGNAGVSGNFSLNNSRVFTGINLGSQFYPSANSPLIAAANTSLTLTGTADDHNSYTRDNSWDIGSYQHGSSVASGGVCFSNGECASGICSNHVCASQGPSVSITSPSNGSTVMAGSNVTITTIASESSGTISRISLYNGAGVLLGQGTSSPYNYVVNNIAAGSYSFYAVATDAAGVSTTSSSINITAQPGVVPSAPVVSITSPASSSTFSAGSNITITTTASETNGTIAKIDLYNGVGVLLGSSTASPYSYVYTNAPAGTYSFYAIATDARGVTTTSRYVTITVTTPIVPVVSITSPANGSTFTYNSSVTITANASEAGGSIANVKFYYNTSNLLCTATSAPYACTVNGVQTGSYTLTAVATDTAGVSTTSSPVAVTVAAVTPPPTSAPVVSITSPVSGSIFPPSSSVTITANASEAGGSIANVKFYYNTSNLLCTASAAPYICMVNGVQTGSYTLTAVATDTAGVSTTSSPVAVTVGAATPPPPPKPVPVVSITSPATGSTLDYNSSVTINASASEMGGSIASVKFYYNSSNLLCTATTAPYTCTVNGVQTGSYALTAVATDTAGVSTTSSPVAVTVAAPSVPPILAPIVAITSPASGSIAPAYSSVTITASASETGGSIANVKFYYNTSNLLCTATTPPYTCTVNNVQPGSYTLTAVATDARGNFTTSLAVPVTVSPP